MSTRVCVSRCGWLCERLSVVNVVTTELIVHIALLIVNKHSVDRLSPINRTVLPYYFTAAASQPTNLCRPLCATTNEDGHDTVKRAASAAAKPHFVVSVLSTLTVCYVILAASASQSSSHLPTPEL